MFIGALAGFRPQLQQSRSGNVPGAWGSHHPILASLLSLVAISSHMQGNCGGGCPWERGGGSRHTQQECFFPAWIISPPFSESCSASQLPLTQFKSSLWGLKSLHNYIPPSHSHTQTSCLTQGQTWTVDNATKVPARVWPQVPGSPTNRAIP